MWRRLEARRENERRAHDAAFRDLPRTLLLTQEITGPLRARLLVAGSVARGLFEWDSPVRSAASLSAALAVVWAGLVPYVVPGGVVLLVALLLLLRRHRHAPGSFAVAAPVRPRRPNPIARIRRIRQNIHKARDTLQAGNEVLLRVYALVNWESPWHSKVVVCYLTAVGSFLLVMPWRIILTLLVAHCYTYRTEWRRPSLERLQRISHRVG